jgi:hypothetical protein
MGIVKKLKIVRNIPTAILTNEKKLLYSRVAYKNVWRP